MTGAHGGPAAPDPTATRGAMSPLPDRLDIDYAGTRLTLLGERALYWPAQRRLVIADLHLGKGDVFRRAGISLPSGDTQADLARLSRLVAAVDAESVWIVGDLLHGPLRAAPWLDSWQAWRTAHTGLAVAVVPGNHDRRLDAAVLGIERLPAVVPDPPFAFCHEPQDAPAPAITISGHLHPTASAGRQGRRWPAFLIRPDGIVLPAFSAFTGGPRFKPSPRERLVLCVEGGVLALS